MFVPGTVGRGSGVAEAVGVDVDLELGAGVTVGVIVEVVVGIDEAVAVRVVDDVGVGVDETVGVVEAVGMVVSGAGVVVVFGAAVWLVGCSWAPREAAPAVAGAAMSNTSSSISLICTKIGMTGVSPGNEP